MDEYVVYFLASPGGRTGGFVETQETPRGRPSVFADYPAALSESYMLVNPNPN